MTHEAGIEAYNNIKLNVVAKDKLLVMAYEHAIRFLKLAKVEQGKKNHYESFQLVLKSIKSFVNCRILSIWISLKSRFLCSVSTIT